MVSLVWHKDGEHYVGFGSASEAKAGLEPLWRVDQVWSPNPKGYGWYVSGLEDLGYYDSANIAKRICQRRTQSALEKRERAIR